MQRKPFLVWLHLGAGRENWTARIGEPSGTRSTHFSADSKDKDITALHLSFYLLKIASIPNSNSAAQIKHENKIFCWISPCAPLFSRKPKTIQRHGMHLQTVGQFWMHIALVLLNNKWVAWSLCRTELKGIAPNFGCPHLWCAGATLFSMSSHIAPSHKFITWHFAQYGKKLDWYFPDIDGNKDSSTLAAVRNFK